MNLKLAVALFLITFPALCSSQGLAPKEIFNSASKSIVVVVTGDATGKPLLQGSGVVFGKGLVLTNCHVLEGAKKIEVGAQGKAYTAIRLRNDKDRDLCSLSVAGLSAPKVRTGSVSNLSVGDKVFAIGAPRGLDLTFTDGLISSIRGGQLLQTTAAISQGSSGGGLFDEYGQLVGITTLYFEDSQGLNFAVPVEWATALASNQSGVSASQDRSEDEIAAVRAQLDKYEEELRATDPDYDQLQPKLYALLPEILKKYPSSQWLDVTKQAYEGIREEYWRAAEDAAAAATDAARSEAEKEESIAQLNRYEEELRASDPDYDEYIRPILLSALRKIVQNYPASQWLAKTKEAYAGARADMKAAALDAARSAPAVASARDASKSRPTNMEFPALRVVTIDGEMFDLAAQRGKWVVVNFWATWCGPCLKEMSELSMLATRRDEVEVIGLNYEDIELEDLKTYIRKHPVGYPIAIVDVYDPPQDFGVPRGLPNTYLIAPNGKFVKHFLEPITTKDIDVAIAEVGP